MKIEIKLGNNFEKTFSRINKKYGEAFAALNGLHARQLNYTDFIDNFIDKQNVADSSIDGNANVNHKNVTALENEMHKPHMKLLAFNKIFHEMEKKYGVKRAKEALEAEWNGAFYLHDAYSSTMKSYCYAYDLSTLAEKGLFFIEQFNSRPPRHLNTFIDFVGEFVSFAANQTSGAVGLADFLYWAYYFFYEDVKNNYYAQETPELFFKQEMQRIIYKLNQPYLRVTQSAFTNVTICDRPYFEALFGGRIFPNGEYAIDHIEQFMGIQKWFMEIASKIRSENVMTFPVLTFALLFDGKKFIDEETARWASKHNMLWADSNFYISDSVDSLSNCCRLKSNIADLGYTNSIGGTALSVGSVKVNTINLARIAYEAGGEEKKYLSILKQRTELCLEVLDVIRNIIRRNVEKKILTNYREGLINADNQYNTIGINGFYEALEEFGYIETDEFGNVSYTKDGKRFGAKILSTIHKTKDKWRKRHEISYLINLEQVPAERCAPILQQKDQLLYPDKAYTLPLYGNQWVPLGVKTTIKEKVESSADFDEKCSGGSILHINISSNFPTEEAAWEALMYMAKSKVPYFAFNLRISACSNNHGFFGEICPICGGKKVTTYVRIVGFIVNEKNFSSERKKEFTLRDWFNMAEMSEM